jgi:hypothetical protein
MQACLRSILPERPWQYSFRFEKRLGRSYASYPRRAGKRLPLPNFDQDEIEMNNIAMLLRFGLLSWLLLCSVAAAAPPADVAGKIDAGTWQKVESGEVRELLILFESAAIDAELNAHLTRRKIKLEDDTALGLRAERYRRIKQSAHAALRVNDALVLRDYVHLPMRLVRIGDTDALLRILQRPEVAAVMEDAKAYLHLTESLPLVGQPSVVGTMGRTGAGTTVVVLDTGLTYTRAEFGSCTSPGVPAGCKVVAAFDAAPDDGALDDNGHGTKVAGTVAGIAPGASIAAIDVFVGNSASSSDILEGIDWAIANRTTYNIVAINMSLGDGGNYSSPCDSLFSNPFRQPIINARNAGILTIASSGNDRYTTGIANPACTPEAVSVGAVYDANVGSATWGACSDSTSAADKVTCFSNSASFLSLLAPGALITVTGATVGGTSFSAPLVAGALAVMAQAFPGDTPTNRLARLTGNGTAVTDSRNGIVTPRLNLLAAQGAPSNDSFASAATLTGLAGQSTGWNLNATKETGEPGHAGNSGGKSVWWKWTAPAAGTLSLDTHGSGFDTLLGLYTGASITALTTVSSNDNDGSPGNASGLSATVSAGTSYRIAVDGKNGVSGGVTLNWSLQQAQAQTISFTQPADLPLGSAFSLGATASSGLPVSYASQTPAICTVSGDTTTLVAAGVCSIAANQAGNANWLPAPQVVQSFTVTKRSQTISFSGPGNQTLATPPFAVSASASSGLPVTIVSLTTASCSITGDTVTLIAVGTCTLQASQAGDAAYLAATPVTNSFAIAISSGGGETGGSGEIPTLPEWGAILLGLLLFAIVYRQRRTNGSGLPPSSFGTGLAVGPGAGRPNTELRRKGR